MQEHVNSALKPMTISELQRIIKGTISAPVFQNLWVVGQISGFKQASRGGHWYFDLKDENANLITCAMWASSIPGCRHHFMPKGVPSDGAQVIVRGYLSFYEKNGRLSLIAQTMEPDGIGRLWMLFQETRQRLQAEGLFDSAHKKRVPAYPKKIALLTSESGEVRHDVCKVARYRNPAIPICLVPIPVQGIDAVQGIVKGLQIAQQINDVDVIILARGGGSMEDLWCFNDERVVRAIYESRIPVVTGIGHEPDFTIADDVADLRASTPSNAAELVVPDRSYLLQQMVHMRESLTSVMGNRLKSFSDGIMQLRNRISTNSPVLKLDQFVHAQKLLQIRLIHSMRDLLDSYENRIAEADFSLQKAIDDVIRNSEVHLKDAFWQFRAVSPEKRMVELRHELEQLKYQLMRNIEQIVNTQNHAVKQIQTRLNSIAPQHVLERGYAFVTEGTRVITRCSEATELMQLHFSDGSIDVQRVRSQSDQES